MQTVAWLRFEPRTAVLQGISNKPLCYLSTYHVTVGFKVNRHGCKKKSDIRPLQFQFSRGFTH